MNEVLYCCKCHRFVQKVVIHHSPNREVFTISYGCHGEAGTMHIPRIDLVDNGPVLIGVEHRRCKTENVRTA